MKRPSKEQPDDAATLARAPDDIYTTDAIFDRLVRVALEESDEGLGELMWSGLAAGLCISLSFFGLIHVAEFVGTDQRLLTALLYPLGFVFIVLGRYQLYTENTLTPVVLVLTRRRTVPDLLRVWGVVLVMNLLGAAIGGAGLFYTGLLDEAGMEAARHIAAHAVSHGAVVAFAKAVVAGWLVAGMTWIVHGTTSTTARILVIWFFLYCVAAFDLVHCIAGTSEVVFAICAGEVTAWMGLSSYILPAILGNTVGGVVLVAILNYAQTSERRRRGTQPLGWKRMLFGTHAD